MPQGLTAAGGPVAAPSLITLPVIRRSKPSGPAWPVFRTFAGAAGVELLADVDRDLLRAFQSALARGGRGRKPLSAPTRHRRLVALRSFLRFCAREGGPSATSASPSIFRTSPSASRSRSRPTSSSALPPPAAATVDEPQLRDAALVAFLLSTGCRISQALQLDRADWDRDPVIVRGNGDVERTAMITEHARAAVERYLGARTDDAPPRFPSYSNARRGQRLSVRGAENVCSRLGVTHRVTKLHLTTSATRRARSSKEEVGDPRPDRRVPRPPRAGIGRRIHGDQPTRPRTRCGSGGYERSPPQTDSGGSLDTDG